LYIIISRRNCWTFFHAVWKCTITIRRRRFDRIFFYYEGGGNRVRSCLHAVENIVDDNYNNNRDIFIAELRCTTSACVLTAVSLWTDGRIACWHENEINKFPLTGRRENFLSVQMVSAWIVGRPDQREIEPRRLARVRVRPDVPNFKRPRDTIARFIVRVWCNLYCRGSSDPPVN